MEEPASVSGEDNKLLVSHDKKKRLDLLQDCKDEVDEGITNVVYKIKEIIDIFVEDYELAKDGELGLGIIQG